MAAESNAKIPAPAGPAPHERAAARFFTAAASGPPSDKQRAAVARLREAVVLLAEHIEAYVPGGRNKSIALTSLEDVQMRANRGIFADEDNR